MTIIEKISAQPELRQVHSRMGFKPGRAEIPDNMITLVEEAISLGRDLSDPRACYDFRKIQHNEINRLVVDGAFTIESEKVYRWMHQCHGLYFAAVTLGPALDQEVARLSNNAEMTRAFLLNAYGAEAAEASMSQLNKLIKSMAEKQNFQTTKRYSPGYGDWHISAQRELLHCLDAERIGISLTEGYLMIPEKSVSAIIGIKPMTEVEDR